MQTIEFINDPIRRRDKVGSRRGPFPDERDAFKFGPYYLIPCRRVLLAGQVQIELGSRAFDILVLLVKRCGEIVSSREIFEHAWPDMIVEDSNIRVQISDLRRALSAHQRSIVTVRSRGYVFVVPVHRLGSLEA
jgi:DNA-binding winged helix-turn-helix (wHTH) protein